MAESTSSTDLTSESASDDVRMGGEGFGNIVMLAVVIAGLVLVAVIVFGILALTGQFQNEYLDPPV